MSSKTDAVVKLAIGFFVSLLSFSIGTFVGKKYSDNQHQLAVLEPQKGTKDAMSEDTRDIASVQTSGEQRSGAMTDDEIAKLAEEFVADDTVPVVSGEEPATPSRREASASDEGTMKAPEAATKEPSKIMPPPMKEKPSPATSQYEEQASPAAKNMVTGRTPSSASSPTAVTKTVPREERLPSSLPKDVAQFAVGKFTVQVAAYPLEAEAQRMASDLREKGYSAFYVPANVKGQVFYRVSVGQFATQKEAQTYRTDFLAKSKIGSAIVQRISE